MKNKIIKPVSTYLVKHIGGMLLLLIIICAAYWIRVQGVDTIPEGQFTSNDAYLYYWQTEIVSEQGFLPERDMHRWVPLGRDNKQLLSCYPYVVAYTHKIITVFFPSITIYQIILYAPVFCFVIAIGTLYLFLYRAFGTLLAGTAGILLATMPSMIDRSSAGFSDRDSWCLMLGLITVIIYLTSLQMPDSRKRLFSTLASGVTCFLGGISWEGFGVFVGIIVFIEIWRFLLAETETDLKYYGLWVVTFVPALFIASPAYRSGGGFTQHIFAFVLIPPTVLLITRYIRHHLITKTKLAKKLRKHTKKLSLGLILIILSIGTLYLINQLDTFTDTVVPFGEKRVMDTVSELKEFLYVHWIFRYGSVFFLGCIGLVLISIHLWERKSIVFIFAITLFTITTFFREQVNTLIGEPMCNILFFISILVAVVGLFLITQLRKDYIEHEVVYIALAAWFLCWLALTRDARRYDFFIGIPIVFFCATLFQLLCDELCDKLSIQGLWRTGIKMSITVGLLAALMWWPPTGAHATRAVYAARHMREPLPSNINTKKAFDWMKENLPQNACVFAGWDQGSQLNVLANVKTIVDQDHYLLHWIHLACRHVYCADNDKEALEFLKAHEATHIMLTLEDMVQRAQLYSSIASTTDDPRLFELIPLERRSAGGKSFLVPYENEYTEILRIDTHPNPENDTILAMATSRAKNGTTEKVEIPYLFRIGNTSVRSQKQTEKDVGGLLIFFSSSKEFLEGYYIPPHGWNSLSVRLFFQGENMDTFIPVYPIAGFQNVNTEAKIWKIQYPPDIKTNPKYLETRPSE